MFSRKFCLASSRLLLAKFIILVVLLANTLAQSTDSSLTGKVKDPAGAVVAGATIVLLNTNTGLRREVVTNVNGEFIYELLPEGNYVVTVKRDGFAQVDLKDVILKPNELRALNIELKVEGVGDVITVTPDADYIRPNANTATKTDTPIFLTPASISVVSSQLIQDRRVQRIEEVLQTVPGISVTSTRITTQNLDSRGFNARQSGNNFRNGLRFIVNSNLAPEITNIDRYEVLKGPASVLYGTGGLGGIINVVTKRPEENKKSFYDIDLSVGSFDFYRAAIDMNTPLSQKILFRFNGSYEQSKSFVQFAGYDKFLLAPVFTFKLSPKTTLTIDTEILRAEYNPSEPGTPAVGSVLPNINGQLFSKSFFSGEPNFSFLNRTQIFTGYMLDHRFDNGWTIHNGFHFNSLNSDTKEVNLIGLTADQRSITRSANTGDNNFADAVATDFYVNGRFKTGFLNHDLVTGTDFYYANEPFFGTTAPIAPLNLFNPIYGAKPSGAFTVFNSSLANQKILGGYIQDQLILRENLRVSLSGRVTFADTERKNFLNNTFVEKQDTKFTPRVGLVYNPINEISVFFSYARSFFPVLGASRSGMMFKPEEGEAFEGGLKAKFLKNKLTGTLSIYRMTRQNVTTTDPQNPGFSIQTGEQRSKGVEIDIQGEPLRGLNFTLAGSYLQANISKDNSIPVGRLIRSVPRFSTSFFGNYEFQKGLLQGFGAGVGIFYVGERAGDLTNTFKLPAYTRGDMAFFYRRKNYELSVNIKNITDKDYFVGSLSRTLVYYGEPITVIGALKLKF